MEKVALPTTVQAVLGPIRSSGANQDIGSFWTLLLTYPLMCPIQMISAQIGRARHSLAR
jgi:hypothetical protein